MFNRRIIILLIALGLTLGLLIWRWNFSQGLSLNAGCDTTSTQRWSLDLSGVWNKYSSLRQAWVAENEEIQGPKSKGLLTSGSKFMLPSSEDIRVAARRFRVPPEWSARTMLLTFNGVKGHAEVYLNGIESVNRIGEFDGTGGKDTLEIPPQVFRYGEENVLLIQLSASAEQRNTLFGLNKPNLGQITGLIRLEAVMETSLSSPEVTIKWDKDKALVSLKTKLIHHGFMESGPWTVQGVLSDGSAEIALGSVTVAANESPVQEVVLNLEVPGARRWSTEDPFLYQFYLTVMNSRGDKDGLAFPLGLYELSFQGGKFILNGKVVPVKGVALLPEAEYSLRNTGQIQEWISARKKEGFNLVYFIGQYPDDLWLQALDKNGLAAWVELPVNMFPVSRLPEPREFENLVREGSKHASIWAWTAGKGLDGIKAEHIIPYIQGVQKLTIGDPVFLLRLTKQQLPGYPPELTPTLTKDQLQGSWGTVSIENEKSVHNLWPEEQKIVYAWALWALFVLIMSLTSVNWRYKEIREKKPRRPLRRAWFWQGIAVLTREGTLAGVFTSLIIHAPEGWGPWFPDQWPVLENLKMQPPWLIWLILGLTLTLLRLVQVGVAAPNLPDSPHPLGLVFWLERRYRWVWIIALLWALKPYGVPLYVPLIAYFGLSLLFLPFRVRDIHRVGGRYGLFTLVPGIILGVILFWNITRWTDWYFLINLISQLYSQVGG